MVAWNRFAKLLQGPGRHWMCGDVAMYDAPCSDLHQEEHIESSETGGHYDQEIAGDEPEGRGHRRTSSQNWRTFVRNHAQSIGRPIGAHRAWTSS